ncbi:class II aldolase/adducin family protein [Clostridium sp.]|uniref:class II aldolase/adducin family protein n=1 Tax=Clostridium sp. TaxID=1506 RepID=UPI00283F961F|nr:class II aldolase/adducin family protein [Clostridium sp.]MDR3594541.1 class II aldolase/adducin family protein [Clostridium sp.]
MLDNLKIKLVKIAQDAEKYDLCREKAGSFSIRDESSGYIIITPSKIKIENLNEEQICIVDLNGNKINVVDGIEPSSDLLMHLEVYKARKDVRTIMHIHPVYTTIFAVVNKVIPPITYDSANYGGYIYIANYDKTKTIEPAKDLIEKLNLSDACLLESNGAILVSREIEDALSKARYVERVAEIYYKSLTLNDFKEPKRFTREELMLYLANQ